MLKKSEANVVNKFLFSLAETILNIIFIDPINRLQVYWFIGNYRNLEISNLICSIHEYIFLSLIHRD